MAIHSVINDISHMRVDNNCCVTQRWKLVEQYSQFNAVTRGVARTRLHEEVVVSKTTYDSLVSCS